MRELINIKSAQITSHIIEYTMYQNGLSPKQASLPPVNSALIFQQRPSLAKKCKKYKIMPITPRPKSNFSDIFILYI